MEKERIPSQSPETITDAAPKGNLLRKAKSVVETSLAIAIAFLMVTEGSLIFDRLNNNLSQIPMDEVGVIVSGIAVGGFFGLLQEIKSIEKMEKDKSPQA